MNLYFFSNRISNPLTGGEIYNLALLEGAEKALLNIVKCEAVSLGKYSKNLIVCNLWYLINVIRSSSKDFIVVDTDLHARCFLSVLVARFLLRKRIIGMLHHYNYWDKDSNVSRKIHYSLEGLISRCFDFLITNSEFSYVNFLKISNNRIPYKILNPFTDGKIINGIRKRTSSKLKFLHIGTVEHRKNVHTTLRAFANIKIDFEFHIVGKMSDNEYCTSLHKIIEEGSIKNKVIFHGFVENDKREALLCDTDIFILVSLMEGYGMAYADAMMYGIPIIASSSGAIPELVKHGLNGFLCEPESVESIESAIGQMADETVRDEMRSNNLIKANTFLNRKQFINESELLFKNLK
jgi:glycosyltransferase involved in cell wall biosynthesis